MALAAMFADFVLFPAESPISYMVYRSFLWEGLSPSISGSARDTITLMAYGMKFFLSASETGSSSKRSVVSVFK